MFTGMGSTYLGNTQSGASIKLKRTQLPSLVRFGEAEKKDNLLSGPGTIPPDVQAEVKRLRGEYPKTCNMGILGQTRPIKQKHFINVESTLLHRASYNLHQDKDVLLPYLPYRKKLVDAVKADPKAAEARKNLARYDALVDKILKQTQFIEVTDTEPFYKKMGEFHHTQGGKISDWKIFRPIKNFFRFLHRLVCGVRSAFSTDFRRKYILSHITKAQQKGRKIEPGQIDSFFKEVNSDGLVSKAKIDASSKYIFAAGVAELFHKKPEYMDQALPAQIDKHAKNLRIVIGKGDMYKGFAGQYRAGLNTILLHQFPLWSRAAEQKHVSQHEFIHALSENENLIALPPGIMSEQQKKSFFDLKEQLFDLYKQNDASWTNATLYGQDEKVTSTGIPYYAFKDDLEFLTVTLDTFKTMPERLCKTEPGQKLYDLYKEILDLDPLNDLKKPEKVEESLEPELSQAA